MCIRDRTAIYQSFTHSKYNSDECISAYHTWYSGAAVLFSKFFQSSDDEYKIFRNEMGAAWVLQSEYSTIVVPGFEIPDIKGAINPRKLAIVLNDKKHIRSSLNKFRERFLDLFNLPNLDDDIVWENNRNSFIEVVLQKDKLTE